MSAAPLYTTPIMQVAPAEEPTSTYGEAPSVRQLILASKGMHPAVRPVLAEICNMAENGSHKCYDGGNEFLANKLGITVPMVSRHIKNLLAAGLLASSEGGKGKRRSLSASPELAAAYRSGNTERITEVVIKNYRSGKSSITEVVNENYRSGKHKLKEDIREVETSSSLSATADLHSKNLRIAELTSLLADRDREIAELRAQLEKKKAPRGGGSKKAALSDPLMGKGKLILDAYIEWYKEQTGVQPKLRMGADQAAAKEIYAYLLSQATNKDDEGVVAAFGYVLQNWNRLDAFTQKGKALLQINSNLVNILPQLRNGQPKQPARAGLVNNTAVDDNIRELKELGIL